MSEINNNNMKKKIREFLQWALYGGTLESYRECCEELHTTVYNQKVMNERLRNERDEAKAEAVKSKDSYERMSVQLSDRIAQVMALQTQLNTVERERDVAKLINEQITNDRDRLAARYKSEQKRCSSLLGTIRGMKNHIKVLENEKA